MLRYGRARFVVFGIVPAINAIALLLFGLGLATNGSWGTEKAVPLLVVMAAVCLLATCAAVLKRGRDLDWKPTGSVAGLVLSIGLFPILPLFLGYLALAPGNSAQNEFGPVASAIPVWGWVWSIVTTLSPWFVAITAARMM
jgi:hypothetical protein